MNRQKFIEYLRNPQNLSTTQLDELEELLVDYPYFQDGRTLLAKGKKLLSAADAQKYITSAAVYAPDRLLLKKYLSQDLFFLKPLKIPAVSEEIENPERRVETEEDKLKPATKEASSITARPPEPPAPQENEPKAEQTPKEESKTEDLILPDKPASDLDALIAEIMQDMEDLKKSKARFKALNDKLEEDDAINDAIEKSNKKSENVNSSSASEVKKKAVAKAEKEKTPPKTKATPSTKAPVKKATPVKTTKASSTLAKKSTGKKTETKETSKQVAPKKIPSQKVKPDKQEKLQQNEIIEDFIKNEPTIQRKTQIKVDGEATNNDLAAKSSRFHVDVSSEYLAEIYIGQGKNARAIEIYENLGLKFPEKSAYFAGLIENLKKKES